MKARKRVTPRIVKSIRTEETQAPIRRPYYIYGLAEYGGHIFYIGMTTDPKGRYQQHLAGDDNQRKTGMIMHVYGRVEMIILDTTMDFERAQQLESFWILYHILDQQYLTNTQMGVALELWELDDEHIDKLVTMLQSRWSKANADRWQRERNGPYGLGWWHYMKGITIESETRKRKRGEELETEPTLKFPQKHT